MEPWDEPVEKEDAEDVDTQSCTCHCGYFCCNCLDIREEDFL